MVLDVLILLVGLLGGWFGHYFYSRPAPTPLIVKVPALPPTLFEPIPTVPDVGEFNHHVHVLLSENGGITSIRRGNFPPPQTINRPHGKLPADTFDVDEMYSDSKKTFYRLRAK